MVEAAPENIHGTGLVLGQHGVIIRGPSGAGKSLLALELLDRWEHRRLNARLVADDRLDLRLQADGLMMAAPAAIAGLIELRGRGIVERPHVPAAAVHLVVDLVDGLTRMLDEADLETHMMGVRLARCPVPRRGTVDSAHQILLVAEALAHL
ncbi:hypothetical protein GCM10011321_31030 [Youhaiella tibetensis]|uniref:HPr kinase/phosphorylase C-terminal domain-containing protein n=1 Tax=Paradevosia tibetensis TaxID=1447062 RepID=A0A5B9DI07_9HYPH|nr:hypothetical protein [Youhaiella tibetensis]QEE18931.1 hypothetical protein FNA67_01500 [Youhaiella tibetensis]GGF37880.1 hypothetical protein GCM10011321_31030 [Youhaiella tibetensis]